MDPSVENLISSYEGEALGERIAERFRADFGDTDRVMMVLVEAPDVLQREPLQYLHDVTRHVTEEDWVDRVVSLTETPMPRRITPVEETGGFDDLEEELGGGDDEGGGGFDSLEEELDQPDQDDFAPGVVDALVSLVEADPERFPGGFRELGLRLQRELVTDPVVDGDTVTDEDVAELRDALGQSGLVDGRLVSRDRTLAVSALFLKSIAPKEMRKRVAELRDWLAANPPPEGIKVHLGGLPYLRSAIVENIRSDQLMLVPLTLLVSMLFLGLTLRWLWGVFLPIGAVALTAVMVVGTMALVGEPMNVLNNIIPTLLIIIGISDSIHLVARYREELQRGDGEKLPAVQRMVRTMGAACFLTSLTTAVGLASLAVSKTVMLRHFGVTSACGVMVAYLVTITFVPAVSSWVKKPKPRTKENGAWIDVALMRLTAWVLKRPAMILGATALILGGSIYGATQIEVDHALLDQFDESDPVYITTRLLEDKLDGVRPLEVSLSSEDDGRFFDPAVLAKIDEIGGWAQDRDEILSWTSQSTILRQSLFLLSNDRNALTAPFVNGEQVRALNRIMSARDADKSPLKAWVTPDGRRMRFQIKVRDIGAQATMRFIDELDGRLRTSLEGTGVAVAYTGEAYDGSVGMDAVVNDLLGSLVTAVAIIFVLLSLLFRSLRLGLLSIPPNLLPLVGTMAYMVVRGIPLNAATGIVFSIALGLGVDGSIHVLARFREETREKGFMAHPALIRAARGTGRAIVVSSVTLAAGFAVLLLSNFIPVRLFGELIAVTVFATLFATLIVQPALLQVAGMSRRMKAAAAARPKATSLAE
ncbi:MAG: MMPL family transporter [Sandaracinus sp.]|nr:MMPL family transporter [Sandaracinus sp.]